MKELGSGGEEGPLDIERGEFALEPRRKGTGAPQAILRRYEKVVSPTSDCSRGIESSI